MPREYDVAIIGAGPAGTTLGTLLAQAGRSVIIVEKQSLPRYQIGESLLPATVRDLADMLGIRAELDNGSLMTKRGATFSWGNRPEELWNLNFGGPLSEEKLLAPSTPSAFNVCRESFDMLLVSNARKHGVTVNEQCKVESLTHDSPTPGNFRVNGFIYKNPNGQSIEIRSQFVADASGQHSQLARQLGTRTLSKFFRKLAVWSYYENGDRLEEPLTGNVLFQTTEDAWLWFIPLTDKLTSVGVVASPADFSQKDTGPKDARPECFLKEKIMACPLIARLLSGASLSNKAPYNTTRVCSEYSYSYSSFSRPGALLLGDAACFVDVLLSSGVHLATYAAVLAAQSINATLDGNVTEELAMNEYETRLRKEYALFYDGLVGLYDMSLAADDYAFWLRKLLVNTSGIVFEADSVPPCSECTADARKLLQLSRQNLAAMRGYTLQQLNYEGDAVRTPRTLPELSTVLYGDRQQRTWMPALKPDAQQALTLAVKM